MKLEKMGMRTIKTGIAVIICVLLGKVLVENVFYSAVACIISMQDTVKGSLKAGLSRVKGTLLGGIIGFIFVLIRPQDPILCGIGVMSIIYICNTLKINSSVVVSCVTFLSILLGNIGGNVAAFSISRVIDTSVGVVFGVVINYLLARPNYLENTITEFKKTEKLASRLVEQKILSKENINIDKFKKQIQRLEHVYSKLLDELYYSRNQVDIDQLEKIMRVCREIYFHMQSIELLDKKLYLNEKNYNNLKNLYKVEHLNWEIDEKKSPVFNYHLKKVVEEIKELQILNNSK